MGRGLRLTVALAAVLGAPIGAPAFVGHDEVTYPVRYRVAVLARFNGKRLHSDGAYSVKWQGLYFRKVERDVLSFDGPDTFHWEKLLRDGTPLAGSYTGTTPEAITVEIDVDSHPALSRGVFPFNRENGICRAGLETVKLSEDLAALRGHGSYRIDRPDRDLLTGTTQFRFRGKRL